MENSQERADALINLAAFPREYITVNQFAWVMGYEKRFVYAQIEKGALDASWIRRVVRIRLVDACRYEGVEPSPDRASYHYGDATLPILRGVYFIQCEQFVKIGYAADVRDRMADIAGNVPFELKLLAVLQLPTVPYQGLRRVEGEIHACFQHLRSSGEWFHGAPELLDFIRTGLDDWRAGTEVVRPPTHDLSARQKREAPRHARREIPPYSPSGSGDARLAN